MFKANKLLVSFIFLTFSSLSQTAVGIYHIDDLLKRISQTDTTYVVNFWATWCKPCVEELPAFDSLNNTFKNSKKRLILVSLDFKEELDKKVKPFLSQKKITANCVLLDEVNGNNFINKIDSMWSGAIPATLIRSKNNNLFLERKLRYAELQRILNDFQKN